MITVIFIKKKEKAPTKGKSFKKILSAICTRPSVTHNLSYARLGYVFFVCNTFFGPYETERCVYPSYTLSERYSNHMSVVLEICLSV